MVSDEDAVDGKRSALVTMGTVPWGQFGQKVQAGQVVSALRCFRRHVRPGGLVVVEPWFAPEQWNAGMVHMLSVDEPELKICRMSSSGGEGRISQIRFHYLVGTPAGIEHLEETHELALYTPDEMLGFFAAAGLGVRHDPEGIFGRGLYLAKVDP